MTITRNDLKIFKPEQLGSSDDAGGQRTRNTVESGQINELFKAISDIDHAQSSIDIVKCFPALDTNDTSTLSDSHVFISEPPSDPLVNIFMIESDALDDESRMLEMKEIIESSVTAGELIREGAPGFLVNQNSFSSNYLQSKYTFNGREYWKTTYLRVGDVFAISVEYPDAEDSNWPRKTHYCKVTSAHIPNGGVGKITFSPPIPFATPEPGLNINGHSYCTRLRHANAASPLTFHGVTRLTADASSNALPVESTELSLLPAITTLVAKPGNSIGADSSGGDATVSQLLRKVLTQPAQEGVYSYTFTTPDLLHDDDNLTSISLVPFGTYSGKNNWVQSITIGSGTVTVSLIPNISPNATGVVALYYVSSYKYSLYNSGAASFPAGKQLTVGTLKGQVVFDDPNYATQAVLEKSDETSGKLYDGTEHLATIDYLSGEITKQSVSRGNFSLTYSGMVESIEGFASGETSATFSLGASNPVLGSFYFQVERISDRSLMSASADEAGVISGSGITGTINNDLVELIFSAAVDLNTLRFDITEQLRQLPSADIYGLNPLRIPNEGIVDMFREWGTVAIQHTQYQTIISPQAGTQINIRADARFVDIVDANVVSLYSPEGVHYSTDLETGTVTINSDFNGFTAPFVLSETIGELGLISTTADKLLTLAKPLTREYPAGSTVASVMILGDLQGRVGKVRDMTAWANNWELDGASATGNYNAVDYPIEVQNTAAINEDWVIIFTSASAFRLVGRRLGQIATGDTLSDFSPVNPLTNEPYFNLRAAGFGGGWQAGEAIRFPTFASSKPIMLLRNVQVGHSQIDHDKAVIAFRGNET